MDLSDVYLVVVRLPGWEFMASASHINANKAVRGLAADLQDFYENGQRNSAAHLMQQGARAAMAYQAAGDRAAIEAVGEHTALTGELVDLELAERRFELKRKTEDWDQSLKERQLMIDKQKLELADSLMESLQGLDPDWRADTRLQQHAKDLLCSTHIESRHTVKKIEHAQALDAQRGAVWRGKQCPHGRRFYRCSDDKCVRYRLERQSRRAEQDELENAVI
jgi:hypothetical protein